MQIHLCWSYTRIFYEKLRISTSTERSLKLLDFEYSEIYAPTKYVLLLVIRKKVLILLLQQTMFEINLTY